MEKKKMGQLHFVLLHDRLSSVCVGVLRCCLALRQRRPLPARFGINKVDFGFMSRLMLPGCAVLRGPVILHRL